MSRSSNLARSVREAYQLAWDAFYEFDFYSGTTYEDTAAYHGESLDAAVRILLLKIEAAFEFLRMPGIATRLLEDVAPHTARGMTAAPVNDVVYSPILEAIRPYVEIIDGVVGQSVPVSSDDGRRRVLQQILKSTGRYLLERKVHPASEAVVRNEMFPLLKAAFEDAEREVHIAQASKTYSADFGVPSVGTLVEYKFCDSKQEWQKAIGEVYTDMKGYSGTTEWQHFYAVFYLTGPYALQEEIDAEFAKTASESWRPIVVIASGGRNRKPKKTGTKSTSSSEHEATGTTTDGES